MPRRLVDPPTEAIRRLRLAGLTLRRIAALVHVSRAYVHRYVVAQDIRHPRDRRRREPARSYKAARADVLRVGAGRLADLSRE